MFKEQDPVCFCGTNTDQDVTQEFANAQVKLQNPLEPHYGLTHQSHYGLTRQSKGRYFPPTLNQHSSSMLVLMDYRVILNMCFKIDVHVCPCVCVCPCVRVCVSHGGQERVRAPGAKVAGGCELPNVGSGH